MKEIIQVNIGQAGIQIGDEYWELMNKMHGESLNKQINPQIDVGMDINRYYSQSNANKLIPRAIFIDTEADIIQKIQLGRHKGIYKGNNLINSKWAAALYSRAFYKYTDDLLENSLECIRKEVEGCQHFDGFTLNHSICGGTGSGFASKLFRKLTDLYPKQAKISYTVFPSKNISNLVIEPYNVVLSTSLLIDHINLSHVIDNESCLKLLYNQFEKEELGNQDINKLISQVQTLTQDQHLTEMASNLVPYPRIHGVNLSIEASETVKSQDQIKQAFKQSNTMTDINLLDGKYISCSIYFQDQLDRRDLHQSLNDWKFASNSQFYDWVPNNFNIFFNNKEYLLANKNYMKIKQFTVTVMNTSAITQKYKDIGYNFDRMFANRSFVHWYSGVGEMEEGELIEAREDLEALILDFWDGSGCDFIEDEYENENEEINAL